MAAAAVVAAVQLRGGGPATPDAAVADETIDVSYATSRTATSGPRATLARQMDLRTETVREVGTFRPTRGAEHTLYLAERSDGQKCLVEEAVSGKAPTGEPLRVRGAACSPDLLERAPVALIVGRDGGPGAASTRAIYVMGVAAAAVERLELVDSRGSKHELALNASHAFFHRSPAALLEQGIEPVELIATQRDARVWRTPIK
ncbi:MAG: hypothetical protein M3321_02220 [Actinomycetota bacterium]|nr:hypothetical protein [Actinomycetota bacterium]